MTKKEKQYLQEEEASAYLYYVENKECFGVGHPHTISIGQMGYGKYNIGWIEC